MLVVVEKLKVVISLVEGVRMRGRDRGLERFDGDHGIAQREENNFFFFDKRRREIDMRLREDV